MKKRLAIITTHPIQYNAPVFKLLTERKNISIKVFYTWGEQVMENKLDPGFGKTVAWDIPLLEDYDYEFVNNISSSPGSHHFKGIDNPNLIASIEEWKADAILVYGWAFRSHLKLLRYFHGKIPVLFRGDSTLLDEKPGWKQLLRSVFLKWVYRHVDKVLYAGSANKDYFLAHGIQPGQLVFAGHAIDNNRFTANEVNEEEGKKIRQALGIPGEHMVYLFAGKLQPKKNPRLLCKAFVETGLPTTHLLITGNGILENALKSDFTNKNNIHFMDFQNQSAMPALYQAADVFVLPSAGPGETWGLAVNEAMAGGKPVIVSDACGCASDLVEHGVNGYVFEHGKQLSLVKVLQKIYTNPNRLKEMGKASYQKIQNFSLQKLAEAVEGIVLH